MNIYALTDEELLAWREQISERLKVMASTAGSVSELARRAGIPVSTVAAQVSDGRRVDAVRLAQLAEAAKVPLEWVIYGDERTGGAERNIAKEKEPTPYGAGELFFIKMYGAMAGAKSGGVVNEGADVIDTRAFRADWVRNRLRARPEDLALLIAWGDSMSPLISDGDSILVDLRIKEPRNDDVYVIRSGSSLQVKRLQRVLGGIRVLSENQAYPAEEISDADMAGGDWECVGRVVWWAHTNA